MTKAALASKESAPSSASSVLAAVPAESAAPQQLDVLPSVIEFSVTFDPTTASTPVITPPPGVIVQNNVLRIFGNYSGSLMWTINSPGLFFVPGVMFMNNLPPTTPWPTEVIPLPTTKSIQIPWFNGLRAGGTSEFFSYSLSVVTSGGQIFTIDPTVENDPPTT